MKMKNTKRLDEAYAIFKAKYAGRLTFEGEKWFVDGEPDWGATLFTWVTQLPGLDRSWHLQHIVMRAKRDPMFSAWLDAESRGLIG